jgi:hypothetical protein
MINMFPTPDYGNIHSVKYRISSLINDIDNIFFEIDISPTIDDDRKEKLYEDLSNVKEILKKMI